jgi:NAD(P)-dependent dehydrogenase (short-subunit alcohol dehydrogenase family)
MDFAGKVALITGAGNGIGRAASLAFAQRGALVVLVDRDTAAGEEAAASIVAQGGNARFIVADVTRSENVQAYVRAALEAHGTIDCFFNNAGIEGRVAPTVECDEATFDAVMAVNVKGVFLGLRYVLPVSSVSGGEPWSTPLRRPEWRARRGCRPMPRRNTR